MNRSHVRSASGLGLERSVAGSGSLYLVTPGVSRPSEASSFEEPETWLVLVVWVLALLAVGASMLRGGLFGTDASLAVPFALFCPFLLREPAGELLRKLVSALGHRGD